MAWKASRRAPSFLLLMFCLLLISWVFVLPVRAGPLSYGCGGGTTCKIWCSQLSWLVKKVIFTNSDSFSSGRMLSIIIIIFRILIASILKLETVFAISKQISNILRLMWMSHLGLLVFLLLTLLLIVHILDRNTWRCHCLIRLLWDILIYLRWLN